MAAYTHILVMFQDHRPFIDRAHNLTALPKTPLSGGVRVYASRKVHNINGQSRKMNEGTVYESQKPTYFSQYTIEIMPTTDATLITQKKKNVVRSRVILGSMSTRRPFLSVEGITLLGICSNRSVAMFGLLHDQRSLTVDY